MLRKILVLSVAFSLVGSLLSGCKEISDKAVLDSSGRIVLAAGLPVEQQQQMQRDLDRFRALRLASSENRISYLKQAMGLPTIDSQGLFNWLTERVKFILGQDFVLDYDSVVELGPFPRGYGYSNESIDFPLSHASVISRLSPQLEIAMLNLGTSAYMASKENRVLVGLRIPGWDPLVPVRSPRVGIIQVGKALFSVSMSGKADDADSEANSLFRTGVFFHESRHSDGHDSSLGFAHAACPAWHPYAGQFACDDNENGPYGIESRLLGVFRDSCVTCTEKEQISLQLQEADDLARVTCSRQPKVNSSVDELMVRMCKDSNELERIFDRDVSELCRQLLKSDMAAPAVTDTPCWWDPTPESV